MDLKIFPKNELIFVLGALRTLALVNGTFTEAERALVEGVARIHGFTVDADELVPVSFERVAQIVTDPHRRKRAVQLALVAALVEGTPSEETNDAVADFARALEIDEAGLVVLREMTQGQAFFARIDMFRRLRSYMGRIPNFPGLFKMVLPALGFDVDRELAASYHELEHCAPGTLGRAVYDHFHDNHFKFPGEAGGIYLVFHDLGHVLSGYGTDPQSEIQQAAFQAGFSRNDGFTFLLFGILQFHVGLRITPVANGYEGLFDVPRVLTALERGASCKVDLTQGYDIFANKDRSLEEVRSELGIPPLEVIPTSSAA
jgi:hypothetical protein